jgi:hypothetical protein
VSASIVELMAGVAFFMVAFAAGLLVVGLLLWRFGRRKWHAVRDHGLVVGALTLWEVSAPIRARFTPPPADVGTWTARQARRQMWRAVERAVRAVRAADDVGATTVSLASICARLRASVRSLDTVLRVEPSGVLPVELRAQVGDVLRASSDVQRAAVASAGDLNGQRVRALVQDADHELQCLDAGLDAARTALPGPN